MTTRLEQAEKNITAGSYKKVLVELWYAEAEHRADEAGLRQALGLVGAVKEQTTGRVWKDAELLESALTSDLERARHEPTTSGGLGLSSEAPKGRFAKLWLLGWPPLFIAAFIASTLVHDPASILGGTSELVLILLGLAGVVIWILRSLILLIGYAVSPHHSK